MAENSELVVLPDAAAPMRRLEQVSYCVLVLAYLLPVWCYRYIPTQDGPSHLANAVILRDYGKPETRHHEFFELSYQPFPNWTSHQALAVLSYVMPPALAEKIFVTGYVVGFAVACRFFLASWPGAALLAPLCLLFVFNRCFFMGFYNYCLSVALGFLILGICMRLPERLSVGMLVALTGLFVLTYFTHLVGYAEAALGAVIVVLFLPGRRRWRLLCLAAALLPSAVLVVNYLVSTGVDTGAIAASAGRRMEGSIASSAGFVRFWSGLKNLNGDIFNPYDAWSVPVGSWWLWTVAILLLVELCSRPWRTPATAATNAAQAARLPMIIFGVVMLLLYLSVQDDFGRHGSFMKPRLALWLPLVALALLKPPTCRWLRVPAVVACYALAEVHLVSTCSHFSAANQRLREYAAGIDSMGRNRVLYVVQNLAQPPGKADYLLHASGRYCLDSGCTSLDNYEATSHYFPVRFLPGVQRGRGTMNEFNVYPGRAAVDRILMWDCSARSGPPDGYRQVFRSGCLAIFARQSTGPK